MTSAPPPHTSGRPNNSLHYAVGEISGKLDQVILHLLPRLSDIEGVQGDHNRRITALESYNTAWVARSGVIVGVFTCVTVIIQGVLHVFDIYRLF